MSVPTSHPEFYALLLEELSLETPLRLGGRGVAPEAPGDSSGGRRWGTVPFLRVVDVS